jgi:thiamine-phosphate pyrophosphorylase
VTDDAVLARPAWLEQAVRVLDVGGRDVALHVRGKATASRALFGLVTSLSPHARAAGAVLVVNDRVDVALVTPVDGVHLGRGSLEPRLARSLMGPDVWIGVSAHDGNEAESARREGADYVFLGTIFRTSSHPGVMGLGTEGLAAVTRRLPDVPIIGIGGIGPEKVAGVIDAGAHGVAAIRGVWDAPDPGSAVRLYLEAVGKPGEGQ